MAEIKFGQKVMEKETEKRISEIEGVCVSCISCILYLLCELGGWESSGIQRAHILMFRLTQITDLQQLFRCIISTNYVHSLI